MKTIMPPLLRCTYLDCEVRPTTRISPPYGKDWLGCDTHASAMITALGIGLPQSSQVTATSIPTRHLRVA